MTRLLILSRCSEPRGGADRVIADVCRNLPVRGWEVMLGLTKGARFNAPERYREVYPDLPVVEVDGTLGTRKAKLDAIRRTILAHRPDVVLSMRVFDAYEATARIKDSAGEYKPRLVVGVRSYEEGYLSDVRRYRDVIDGCVTAGRLIAKACVDLCGVEARRVFSIAGGIRSPERLPERWDIHTPIRLLYAGRLEQDQKRARDLVPFVRDFSKRGIPFHLDIAGDGPDMDLIKNQMDPWCKRGEVAFHGWVSRDRLYTDFYPNVDVFVHFAAWEGVANAPREAMVHGVVPVTSRFTGLRAEEQLINGENGLTFDVGDTESAADCIVRLVQDRTLFTRLSTAALRSQQGEYSATGAMDKWDASLRAVMALPPRTGSMPRIREHLPGRLSRLGLPAGMQSRLRSLLKLPVEHADAGSEWPTNSGMITEAERNEIMEFAERADQA